MLRATALLLALPFSLTLAAADVPPADYNITWTTPGASAADSMPLAGGILGANVWVQGNDLLVMMASPNCLDEKGRQVKLGRLRLQFGNGVLERDLRQHLDLRRSTITVSGTTAAGKAVSCTLWCDTGHPVLRAEVRADEPVPLRVAYETWTTYQPAVMPTGVRWVRRLEEVNQRLQKDLAAQGMTEFAHLAVDPLSRLTCGGRVDVSVPVTSEMGKDGRSAIATVVQPVTAADLTVTLRMEQDADLAAWNQGLDRDAERALRDAAADRTATAAWWTEFWGRSHITIARRPGVAEADDQAWLTSRNYALGRYLLAANVRGRAPTLFNGGVFACTGEPDRRNWDECQYMAQNQRLVYWPMLRTGDLDLLAVGLDFYRDRTPLSTAHAKKFWNVDNGVAWNEPFGIFGLDALGTDQDGRSRPGHLKYHFTSGIEFALMMLEYERYGGATRPGYRVPAIGFLRYYDQFYQANTAKRTGKPLDEQGKLVIYPSDACEPYHGCTNNTDVIAGLWALVRTLRDLGTVLTAEERAYVESFATRIPDFPLITTNGRQHFAAAKSWERVMENGNMDFPQMYILFPFDHLFLGRSDMSLARNTWELSPIKASVQHQNQCWYQTPIHFARMGDTAGAARTTIEKWLHPGLRFPTFHVTHYADGKRAFCHAPDMDHIGTGMMGLQEMLLQTDGRRILVGPAWPAEWETDFRLHAPYQTVVEGRVSGGKVIIDRVTPAARAKDVEIFPLKALAKP